MTDEKKWKTFSYPSSVATGDFDQAQLYDTMMHEHVVNFLNGYSTNILAHGQTGSGKTHTILGPKGCLTDVTSAEIIPEFGLFPRAALVILKSLEAQASQRKSLLTMNITETNFRVPVDMMNKRDIKQDPVTNELIG